MKTKILILSIAAVLPAPWTFAQNADGPPRPPGPPREGERRPGPRDGEQPKGKEKDGDRPKGDGPRDGQRPQGPMPMPLLHALDKDEDGIISADEIKGAPDALKKLDKNNDGQLTRDEWQPRPPQGEGAGDRPKGGRDGERKPAARDGERPKGGPREGDAKPDGGKPPGDGPAKGERPAGRPASPLVEALDTDHDGIISADEIGKSSDSLAKLDHNNDGQLGPREYGPRPPQERPPKEGDK